MMFEVQKTAKTQLKVLLKPLSRLKYKILTKIGEICYKIRYANFRPSSSNAVVLGIGDYVASIAVFLERGNVEMFLTRLSELTVKLLSEPLRGRALFIPELDELARKASLVVAPVSNPPTNSKLLVHVATTVYPTGGHTRVIEDIVASLPEYRHVLVTTVMDRSHSMLA
jgi:hypothetical protein